MEQTLASTAYHLDSFHTEQLQWPTLTSLRPSTLHMRPARLDSKLSEPGLIRYTVATSPSVGYAGDDGGHSGDVGGCGGAADSRRGCRGGNDGSVTAAMASVVAVAAAPVAVATARAPRAKPPTAATWAPGATGQATARPHVGAITPGGTCIGGEGTTVVALTAAGEPAKAPSAMQASKEMRVPRPPGTTAAAIGTPR